MDPSELLVDLYGRIPGLVRSALDGMAVDDLVHRPEGAGNSVAWLLWHQTRIQDQLSDLLCRRQLWETGSFAERFGLAADPGDTGFGHSAAQVASVRPDSHGAVIEYADAVSVRLTGFLEAVDPSDLDRVIDDSYDPPVVLGVRLNSVAGDCLQHCGQAAYVRGLLAERD
jgi:hypothetical protein